MVNGHPKKKKKKKKKRGGKTPSNKMNQKNQNPSKIHQKSIKMYSLRSW